MKLSTQNLQYLLGHQFYTLCANKNFAPTIGLVQMSDWRHVRAILMQNKSLQESFSWTQFLTRAGLLLGAERAGPGGVWTPPSNLAPGPYIDTR